MERGRQVVITGAGLCCHLGDELAAITATLRAGRPVAFAEYAPGRDYGARCRWAGLYGGALDDDRQRTRFMGRAGKLAYWAAGFGEFFRSVSQFQVRIDGKEWQCGFVLASRVRNYGGDLEIASGASLLSDDFEVVLFKGSNPLRYAAYMLAVVPRRVQAMPGVRTLRARRLEFTGDAHLQFDGEYGGRVPATFDMVPDALTLLMPPEYR